MRGQSSPAWNPGHTDLVLNDDFSASGVTLREELARRRHEGGYPAVRTGEVGSFRIVGSVVWMTPLSNALRGGGEGQASEGREYIWSSRGWCAPGRKVRDYTHLIASYQRTDSHG